MPHLTTHSHKYPFAKAGVCLEVTQDFDRAELHKMGITWTPHF